jgi:hypothetical protein
MTVEKIGTPGCQSHKKTAPFFAEAQQQQQQKIKHHPPPSIRSRLANSCKARLSRKIMPHTYSPLSVKHGRVTYVLLAGRLSERSAVRGTPLFFFSIGRR